MECKHTNITLQAGKMSHQQKQLSKHDILREIQFRLQGMETHGESKSLIVRQGDKEKHRDM